MRIVLAALLASVLSAASARAVPFADGDFDPAQWEIVVFSFKSSGGAHPGGSVTATQEPGGYPGTLRQVVNGIVAAPSATENSTTWGAHFHAGSVWNPAADGPIGTLDYREDARIFAPQGDGQLTGIAVRQAGVVYVLGVDVTPETVWTEKERKGIHAADLYAITDTGPDFNAHPDFSGTGAPLEFGFFRANSNGNGGGSYSLTGAIDNWRVRVNPPCATPLDCDDGDACTTDDCTGGACAVTEQDCNDQDPCTIDTCAGGTCANAPLTCDDGDACTLDACAQGLCATTPVSCDDGNVCTLDACAAGACQSTALAPFDLVEARIGALVALLRSGACGQETLARGLERKLRKKVAKARARVAKADEATRAAAVARLLGKADTLLGRASDILAGAIQNGLISPTCGAALQAFVQELRICVAGAQ